MKDEKQSFLQWLEQLNPRHRIRILEMLFGTAGGAITAAILHFYIVPEDWPINPPIWIACGLVGLYFGYRNWRDTW